MKNYLSFALLISLVSCSQQDNLEVICGKSDVATRPEVENFHFTLQDNTTRLSYNGRYSFEEGDVLSACLMDVMRGSSDESQNKTWFEKYSLTPFVQTNYPFTRDAEGIWRTEAKLVEGNYFMVFPYSNNAGDRGSFKFSVKDQTITATTNEALMNAFAANNYYVGYSKVLSGNTAGDAVKVNMIPVFGATTIEIKNEGTEAYTIEKVVLNGEKVVLSAVLDPTSCTPEIQFNGAGSTSFNAAQYTQDPVGALSDQSSLSKDGVYYPNYKGALKYDETAALKDVLQYGSAEELTVQFPANTKVEAQKSTKIVVMTAEAALTKDTKNQAILSIYTDKGKIEDIDLSVCYTESMGKNFTTDKALPVIGGGKKVTIAFKDASVQASAAMSITNEEDLLNLIKWNSMKSGQVIAGYLTEDVHITSEIYEKIKSASFKELELVGPYTVIIDADVPAQQLDKIKFHNTVNVFVVGAPKKSDITVGPRHIINERNLTVKENYKDFDYIDNFGVLTITGNADNTIINNYPGAVVRIAAGAKVKSIENKHENWWEPASVVTLEGTVLEELHNYSQVVVASSAVVNSLKNEATGYVVNSGKITKGNNLGKIVALDKSSAMITAGTTGTVDITELKDDGNVAVPAGSKMFQRLKDADQSAIDSRANCVYLEGTLNVSTAKATDTAILPLIVSVSANSRVEGNGPGQIKFSNGALVCEMCKLIISKLTLGYKLDLTGEGLTSTGVINSTVKKNGFVVSGTSISLEDYGM